MEFRLYRVNWGVAKYSKELVSCLVIVVTFFVKGLYSYDRLVSGCDISDSLEDI